jgi:predicted secreted protein
MNHKFSPYGAIMIQTKINLPFRVEFECNPSTGFVWSIIDGTNFELVKEEHVDHNPNMIGDAGKQIFTLKPLKAGNFKLQFELKRPFAYAKPLTVETKNINVRS